MKLKVLTVFGSAVFLVAGCGGGAGNTNTNANANANRGNTAVVTATATPAAADPAVKAAVEDALKKKGFNEVTVEATATTITLRGSVAKGKMSEAVMAAQEAGKKPVNNQLTEK